MKKILWQFIIGKIIKFNGLHLHQKEKQMELVGKIINNIVPLAMIILNFGLKQKELWVKYLENGNRNVVSHFFKDPDMFLVEQVELYSLGMEELVKDLMLIKEKFIQLKFIKEKVFFLELKMEKLYIGN